jgi:hypothetical protein
MDIIIIIILYIFAEWTQPTTLDNVSLKEGRRRTRVGRKSVVVV